MGSRSGLKVLRDHIRIFPTTATPNDYLTLLPEFDKILYSRIEFHYIELFSPLLAIKSLPAKLWTTLRLKPLIVW